MPAARSEQVFSKVTRSTCILAADCHTHTLISNFLEEDVSAFNLDPFLSPVLSLLLPRPLGRLIFHLLI